MSARLSCWLRGHMWGSRSLTTYTDLVGNLWRISSCQQCGAQRRHLVSRWDAL